MRNVVEEQETHLLFCVERRCADVFRLLCLFCGSCDLVATKKNLHALTRLGWMKEKEVGDSTVNLANVSCSWTIIII
jgi:hypothetical protein